jgi:DNA-binding response OmpR family regulator
MKILIVDDDISILSSLKIAMEMEGHQVSVLSEADKTLDLAIKFRPDIIIIDFLLSGITGSHISRQIRSNHTTKKIPIIMISAHPTAVEYAKVTGINSFISKPFELDKLLSEIIKLSSFAKT